MKIVSEHLKILRSKRTIELDNGARKNIENLFRLIYVYGRFMGINNLMLFSTSQSLLGLFLPSSISFSSFLSFMSCCYFEMRFVFVCRAWIFQIFKYLFLSLSLTVKVFADTNLLEDIFFLTQ